MIKNKDFIVYKMSTKIKRLGMKEFKKLQMHSLYQSTTVYILTLFMQLVLLC